MAGRQQPDEGLDELGVQLVAGDATMEVVNPATGAPFATVPRASARQADLAIAAAKRDAGEGADTGRLIRLGLRELSK